MSRKNILIVDRNKDFLLEMREAFVPFKNLYQVAFALNVAKAADILKKFSVHLVLANVQLSGESGIDLLLAVRRWHAGTHVVLYGCDISPELKSSAYHSGVSAVIPCPFRMEDLLNVLARVFAKDAGSAFLDAVPLADLLQLIGMGNLSTDVMVIDAGRKRRGIIRIRKGNMIEAETAGKHGVEAVTEMLSWQEPIIRTCKSSHGISPPDNPESLHDILIQAVARLDENILN